jgi:peptidoglycan/LPS O-acetylase OafA/YrhL
VIGNTFLFSFYSYPANFHKINEISKNYIFITLFNNELAFDTLLFLIAFCTAYDLMEKFDDRIVTTCSFILHVLNFVIKMIFPVIIIVGVASVFALFSSGPLWNIMTDGVVSGCGKFAWTHIFFISNLYPFDNRIGEEGCLPWLWFVSTEFQFFFICLALTILYKNRPFIASLITWLICIGSLCASGIIAGVGSTTTLSQYDNRTYSLLFTKPWSRIFGYSLGLFFGFIMYEFNKESSLEINKRFGWKLISWMENMKIYRRTVFITLAFGLIFIPSIFQWLHIAQNSFGPENSSTSKTMYILYITLGKPIYFTGLIIVTIFCLLNKLKWITTIVGNYIWGPLTELSYSAYLMHFFIIVWYFSSLEQTMFISIPDLIFTSVAVIFVSFAIAVPFSFLIEIPSKNLMELILFTMKRYQNKEEVDESDAKAGTSSGREKVTSGTGMENNISSASANLMFLTGQVGNVDYRTNTKMKFKTD